MRATLKTMELKGKMGQLRRWVGEGSRERKRGNTIPEEICEVSLREGKGASFQEMGGR